MHNHSLLELSSILNANRKNLPKLDLPKFDGEVPEDFLDFIHTFDSMVHNADLEPLDKLSLSLSPHPDDPGGVVYYQQR